MRSRSLGGGGPVVFPVREPLVASVTLDRHLQNAIAEFTPAQDPKPKEASLMSSTETTAPGTGATATSIKDLMEEHKKLMGQIHEAQLELLRSSLARQRDTVSTAVGKVAEKIDGQTADFLAMVGQFSNDLG